MSFKRLESGLLVPEFNIAAPKTPKILPGGHNINQMLQTRAPRRRFTPLATAESYSGNVAALSNLIAYWRQNEISGTNIDNFEGTAARDGTYINTPTLNQTGIGDGLGAPEYDDASSECSDLFSASFVSAFDGDEGTLSLWAKVDDWSTTFTMAMFDKDQFANHIRIISFSAGDLFFSRQASGTQKSITLFGQSSTAWRNYILTWSLSAGADGEFKVYLDGSQQGATQTAIDTWDGAGPSSTRCVVAADDNSGTSGLDGLAAHAAWFTDAKSGGDITTLSTVP